VWVKSNVLKPATVPILSTKRLPDLECLDALETFDISNLKMVKNLIFGNLPENFIKLKH